MYLLELQTPRTERMVELQQLMDALEAQLSVEPRRKLYDLLSAALQEYIALEQQEIQA